MGALMVGFARAIILILTAGNVIDTILFYASSVISKTGTNVAAALIYVFQFLFNFIVPSGSGKAAITMPLIVPNGRHGWHYPPDSCSGLPVGRWSDQPLLAHGRYVVSGYGQCTLQQMGKVVFPAGG